MAYYDPDTGKYFAEIMYASRERREEHDCEITRDMYCRLKTFGDDTDNERSIKTAKPDCLLSHNVGKVLTNTHITRQVCGNSWNNDVVSLRAFTATLRKKPEPFPDSMQFIDIQKNARVPIIN